MAWALGFGTRVVLVPGAHPYGVFPKPRTLEHWVSGGASDTSHNLQTFLHNFLRTIYLVFVLLYCCTLIFYKDESSIVLEEEISSMVERDKNFTINSNL